jgi:hypothetical protein
MECYSLPNSFSKFKYNHVCNAFHDVRNRTESHITSEIERLCKNDKVDFSRIEGLFKLVMLEAASARLAGDEAEFSTQLDGSEEELFLSGALSWIKLSLKFFDTGELKYALNSLGLANQFLGEARAGALSQDYAKNFRLRLDETMAHLVIAEGANGQKDEIIDKYQQGTKSNAAANKAKWALANEYLKEEIPRHRRINDAREAAAHKAGICVATRRLIQMMPDPR